MKLRSLISRLGVALAVGLVTRWLVWPWVEPRPYAVFTFPGVVTSFCRFTPNGRWLVLETHARGKDKYDEYDHGLRFVETETGHQARCYRLGEVWPMRDAAFAPDGKLIVVENRQGDVVTALDGDSHYGKEIMAVPEDRSLPHAASLVSQTLSPDGRWLVMCQQAMPSEAEPRVPPGGNFFGMPANELPADEPMASSSDETFVPDEDEPIEPPVEPPLQAGELWNVDPAEWDRSAPVLTFEYGGFAKGQWVESEIEFSPDGCLMAVSLPREEVWTTRADLIQVWDLKERKLVHTVTGLDGQIWNLRFDSNAQSLRISVIETHGGNQIPRRWCRDVKCDLTSFTLTPDPDRDFSVITEDHGWRVGYRLPDAGSRFLTHAAMELRDPKGRRIRVWDGVSVDETCTASRFVPNSDLLELDVRRCTPSLLIWLWLNVPGIAKFVDFDRPRELHVIDRRTGRSVWYSTGANRGDRGPGGGDPPYWDPYPHAISPDGQVLAEGSSDGHSTTIRFWTLPQRQWPHWFANGLGASTAVVVWRLGRRTPSRRNEAVSRP